MSLLSPAAATASYVWLQGISHDPGLANRRSQSNKSSLISHPQAPLIAASVVRGVPRSGAGGWHPLPSSLGLLRSGFLLFAITTTIPSGTSWTPRVPAGWQKTRSRTSWPSLLPYPACGHVSSLGKERERPRDRQRWLPTCKPTHGGYFKMSDACCRRLHCVVQPQRV